MKKIRLLFLAGCLCYISCNNDAKIAGTTKENSVAEKNLEASRVVDRAFRSGDASGLDSVISDDFVDHTDQGDKKGRDSLKAMVKMVHENFKDMKIETIKEVADEEYVFSWMRYTGTSDGAMGMPKGPYDMQSVEVAKCRDGKIVEHWAFMNVQEMMKMMGQGQGMETKARDSAAVKK